MTDKFNGYMYEKELLPCPFCGKNEEAPPYVSRQNKKHFGIQYTVSCSCCGCEPDGCLDTVEEAIAFWNTRKLHDTNLDFINGFNAAKDVFKKLINELSIKKK